MYIPALARSASSPPDPKIGPMPLTWLIVLCLFGPFVLGSIGYVIYLFTAGRRVKRVQQDEAAVEAEKRRREIEMWARGEWADVRLS